MNNNFNGNINIIGKYTGKSNGIIIGGVMYKKNITTNCIVNRDTFKRILSGVEEGWFELYEPTIDNIESVVKKELDKIAYDDTEVRNQISSLQSEMGNTGKEITQIKAGIEQVNSQIDEIANTGTTVEAVQNKVQTMAEEGQIQAYTIADKSINASTKIADKSITQELISDDVKLGVLIDDENSSIKTTYSSEKIRKELENFNDYKCIEYGNMLRKEEFVGKSLKDMSIIKITEIIEDRYCFKIEVEEGNVSQYPMWFFVDESGNRISNFVKNGASEMSTNLIAGYSLSDIAGIGLFLSTTGDYICKNISLINNFSINLNVYEKSRFEYDSLKNIKNSFQQSYNYFDNTKVLWGYRKSGNGGIEVGTQDDFISYPIDVENHTLLYYKNMLQSYSIHFYDKSLRLKSNVYTSQDSSTEIPAGIKYAIISGDKTNIDKAMVGFTEEILYGKYKGVYELKDNNTVFWNWKGKIGDSLGDSITGQNHFQVFIKNYFSLKRFWNHGIGGTKLSGSANQYGDSMWMSSRINALVNDADFITIMGGRNDGDVSIGEISLSNSDVNTYSGALNVIISKIYYKYLKLNNGMYDNIDYSDIEQVSVAKNIKLYIMSPPYADGDEKKTIVYDMADACRKIAALWGRKCVDINGESGMNKATADICFSETDRVHPLQSCHEEMIAPVIIKNMKDEVI